MGTIGECLRCAFMVFHIMMRFSRQRRKQLDDWHWKWPYSWGLTGAPVYHQAIGQCNAPFAGTSCKYSRFYNSANHGSPSRRIILFELSGKPSRQWVFDTTRTLKCGRCLRIIKYLVTMRPRFDSRWWTFNPAYRSYMYFFVKFDKWTMKKHAYKVVGIQISLHSTIPQRLTFWLSECGVNCKVSPLQSHYLFDYK